MQKSELKGAQLQEAYEKLRVYSALDKKPRLAAFFLIADNPGIEFNSIARKTGVKRPLTAYHLAVLKASGLVTFQYRRNGRATSSYFLTDLGKTTLNEIRAHIGSSK